MQKSKDAINEPLVSVILPTYNRAMICKEAVESVINQSYKNIEIIIVDDGSSDNTEEVVKNIKDERIKYYKKQNEKHAGKTRNYGVNFAKGEYIAFQDDDDLWTPDKLEKQMGELLKQTQYKISYTLYKVFGEGEQRGIQLLPNQQKITGNLFYALSYYGSFLALPSIIIKKEVFEEFGGFAELEELRAGEDYDLWLRISQKYDVLCIPEYLCLVRYQSNSTSEKNISGRAFVIYERVIKKSNLSKKVKNLFLSRAHYIEGERSLSKGNPEFRKHFLKAFLLNPFRFVWWINIVLILFPASFAKRFYFSLKKLQKSLSE